MSEDTQPKQPEPAVPTKKPSAKAKKQSPAVPVLITLLLVGGLGAYLYIQSQQAPVEEPAPTPEPIVVAPEPEPEPIVMAPAPEPEPIIPDPVQIQFAELTEKQELWPRQLELTGQIELEIVYNGETFGEITFTQGQSIQVSGLEAPANIIGKVGGQQLSIPVSKTNLAAWFESTHAANYILTGLDSIHSSRTAGTNTMSDEEFLKELERWCLLNYGDCKIEIGPEKLIFHWKKQQGRISYAEEAALVANHYLKMQAERNQGDNYAQCQIVDIRTGKTLGYNVVFRPVGSSHCWD